MPSRTSDLRGDGMRGRVNSMRRVFVVLLAICLWLSAVGAGSGKAVSMATGTFFIDRLGNAALLIALLNALNNAFIGAFYQLQRHQ